MYKWIQCFLIVGILSVGTEAFTQRLGLLPPSVKWKQLRDDSVRIIFPEGQEETARRVASLMLKVGALDPINPNGRFEPVSVLLQPYTNISNGYVGLAPYVSEFYLQPNEDPFSLGSLPWSDLLAVHEYRHVLQLNAANTGLSHIVKLVFGDLAFTGLYNLAIPDWFREGDAVYAETKWSSQGRGRLSRFTLPFREKLLEGETWNYYKVRNGSYKEFTPDHYPFGYLMVQYGNHLFGEETWDTIIQEAASFKYLLNPFSGPVQARTGGGNKHLYQEAMNWYRDIWKTNQKKDIEYTAVPLTSKHAEDDYFDMNYPDMDGDGSIYTSITTFDQTAAIFKITTEGKRKKIVSMGLQHDTYFDHSNHRFVWTEIRFDPRWLRKDKNVIVAYDEVTKNRTSFEPDKGYFMPSLDQRGTRIVALHVDNRGIYNLFVLDARSGAVLDTLPNPENLYLGHPVWSADERTIIATARDDKGRMALMEQNIATGEMRQITHYSFSVLGKPAIHDGWILLTASLDDLDQVYAVDKTEGIFYQVTGGNSAHYDPSWDPLKDEIVCTEYRLDGKKLVRASGMPGKWKLFNLGSGVKNCEGTMCVDLIGTPSEKRVFEIKNHSPWANAINIHSWTLAVDDPAFGLEVRSNNVMNTISVAGGYEYNRNSKAGGPYVDVRLGMLFPVMSIGVSQSSRKIKIDDGREFRVSNERLNAGLSLPLYYSSGVYQQNVLLSSTYFAGISKVKPPGEFENFNFNYLSHQAVVINSRRRAYRQPLPSWGQRADITYSHELQGVPISQLYISGDLAVPGVRPSNYTLLHGEFLSQDISNGAIQLGSSYGGARGFTEVDGKIQYGGGITYGFPLLYPDLGIGNIFYTKRVRLQMFYDISYTDSEQAFSKWMRSAGGELIFDFEFPPISLGLRYARLLDGYEGSPDIFEIFLPVARF